ncbi:unnamed protein product [Moneuplotes crassus]|uniref:Uncharacterized protein n=1 Tax=Euplotes crassus TaxID=5936 RepID=A0AAD1X910_EUPCR|nr:unnamed protein product [Moneuplotes crassus]
MTFADKELSVRSPIKMMYKSTKERVVKSPNFSSTLDNLKHFINQNKTKLDAQNMRSLSSTLKTLDKPKYKTKDCIFSISKSSGTLKKPTTNGHKKLKFPFRKDLIRSLRAGKSLDRSKSTAKPEISSKILRIIQLEAKPCLKRAMLSTAIFVNSSKFKNQQALPLEIQRKTIFTDKKSKSIQKFTNTKELLQSLRPSFRVNPDVSSLNPDLWSSDLKNLAAKFSRTKQNLSSCVEGTENSHGSYYQTPIQGFHIQINKIPKCKLPKRSI